MFRRFCTQLAVLTATTLMPVLVLAADEHPAEKAEAMGGVKEGVATAITALVVFALVFAVIATKIWPAIARGLDQRADKIREEIEAAEMARRQAKDALEQYQKSLADARSEAQKMIESTKAQQSALAAELRAKSEIELNQLRERAMKDIDTAKRAAVSEIYSQYTSMGTLIAGKILRRNISAEDNQRLVEESLQQLQTSKG
jgi:F-type H+-transporting ATPase subunit b